MEGLNAKIEFVSDISLLIKEGGLYKPGYHNPSYYSKQDTLIYKLGITYEKIFKLEKQMIDVLKDYAKNLDLEHKNLIILALSLYIIYNIYYEKETFVPIVFNSYFDKYFGIYHQIDDDILKIKYKVDTFNYCNYIINNIKEFKKLKHAL